MYDPIGNSKEKEVHFVKFTETKPPQRLSAIVHRFLKIETTKTLSTEYRFHALPDACSYIVFDQQNTEITGVTKLHATSEEFSLGTAFNYINIRLLPGVWQDKTSHGLIDEPYSGPLPLIEINKALTGLNFSDKLLKLIDMIDSFVSEKHIIPNPITEKILTHIFDIQTVTDMADIVGMSPRQLQRVLKQTTGFSPHDFLKVLRLQQSLDGNNDSLTYADQSHFIRAFRKATGYTPGKYNEKYHV